MAQKLERRFFPVVQFLPFVLSEVHDPRRNVDGCPGIPNAFDWTGCGLGLFLSKSAPRKLRTSTKKVIALTSDEPMPSGRTAAGSTEKPDDDMDKPKIISMDMVGSFEVVPTMGVDDESAK